ncbi:MAG: hypothetical protein LBH32_00065, partial [Dysgonamonadaceae bacterium]|nr:hypothetical protein [Dysgonamonadaceae bacterium]
VRLTRKNIIAISAAAAALVVIIAGLIISNSSNKSDMFTPIVEFHNEAFPVKIIATATAETAFDGSPRMIETNNYIGDVIGDFGAKLDGAFSDCDVRIEIESDRFIKKSQIETRLKSNNDVEIFPRINYNYVELGKLKQPLVENITFKLFVNNKLKKETAQTVTFHSLNEVPFLEVSRHDNETLNSYHYMFAAMVNEDHPLIDTILREALQSGAINHILGAKYNVFAGYQDIDENGDREYEVISQVFAVWYVLQSHNIRYSNITRTSTESEYIATQYVRSIEESFANTQSNCVDGSVLFASILRKIGIDTFLVIIPGHMLAGFYIDENHKTPFFIETTMLGNEDITKYGKKRGVEVSLDLFFDALKSGNETVANTDKDDFIIIDIAQCRKAGIRPVRRE